MKATWYFDFISPFSYMQLGKIMALRDRIDITPVPIVFGAVLKHHGQLGPAEIRGKREFTYRSVLWQARQDGVDLRFPPAHPFNPIAALRLAIAAGSTWDAVTAIFEHIWKHGRAADDSESLSQVAQALGIDDVAAATSRDDVKAALRANTEAALADGVFGVPTLRVGDELFWGNDATPMLLDWLGHPRRFAEPEYRRISALPSAVERKR